MNYPEISDYSWKGLLLAGWTARKTGLPFISEPHLIFGLTALHLVSKPLNALHCQVRDMQIKCLYLSLLSATTIYGSSDRTPFSVHYAPDVLEAIEEATRIAKKRECQTIDPFLILEGILNMHQTGSKLLLYHGITGEKLKEVANQKAIILKAA